MKQCSKCQIKMFDGCISCGVCGCADLIELNPKTKAEKDNILKRARKTRSTARPNRKATPRLNRRQATTQPSHTHTTASGFTKTAMVTYLSGRRYEVRSKTNPNKTYIVDLDHMRDHKANCLGYRYSKEANCNHLESMRKAGVAV